MPIPRRLLQQQPQQQHASSATIAAAATSPASPSSTDQPLAPDSDVVLILAALLCAFICVAGLAFIARCAWLRRRVLRATGQLAASPSSSPPPPAKGVDSKVLRALPKLPFHPDLLDPAAAVHGPAAAGKPVAIAADCAICLTEFALGDEVRVLPQCGHGFHAACVDAWLKTRSSCPSCRRVLVVADGASTQSGTRCDKCGKPAGPAGGADGGADFLP